MIGRSPVGTVAISDLRRRRLQTMVIAFVIVLASGAATLALSLLVETDAPYDHAFARARGAHLVLSYDAHRVGAKQLRLTAHARGVSAAVGPWRTVETEIIFGDPNIGPSAAARTTIAGRGRPDTAVDRLTVESGRWPNTAGEIALSQSVADSLGVTTGSRVQVSGHTFVVSGVAASISPVTGAWVLPARVSALVTAGSSAEYEMMYRLRAAATDADLRRATQAIAGRLPPGSVVATSSYLQVKRNADLTSAVMVPFLLAFSAFALLAAVFIISNVVSGVVIASYRDFGILKSIGFTPAQVVLTLLAQTLAPVVAGCMVGIPLGTLASQPFLQQTAHALNLPSPFTAVVPVDLLVLLLVVVTATLAAVSPAWRAGRISAVSAITLGTAPSVGRAAGARARVASLPLPAVIVLGLGDALARPVRSAMTLGAIVTGVATVIFALSLHLSLDQVAVHLIRDRYVQIRVSRPNESIKALPDKGGVVAPSLPPAPSDRQVTAAIRDNPDTARFVAETQETVSVAGIAEPISYYAYRGQSDWIGFALIAGHWFQHRGEVVAPTRLIQQAHLSIGGYFTARVRGTLIRLRLVGEILDQTDSDLIVRGGWAALAPVVPHMAATEYEVQLRSGASTRSYSQALYGTLANGGPTAVDVGESHRSGSDTTFILFNGVIGGLALILTAIAVAGVFNTVVLSTRERARDIAILKAIGMAPVQVVAMVIAGVAFLGAIAGVIGIPAGYVLHREIIQFMGQIASGTAIPPGFFDLIDHRLLPLLALAGVAIAAIGAWLPAQWAASARVAEVLQSE